MDGTLLQAGPLDPATLRRLTAKSDAAGLRHIAGHAAALGATGWLLAAALGSGWAVPATLLHGAVLVFLFAPLHESIHRTAFRSRRLNDAVAWVCGALLALPPDYFRYFHFAHHRDTQNPARDPELARPKPRTLAAWAWHVSGIPYWQAQLGGLLRRARGSTPEPFLRSAAARRRVVREARILLASYAAVALLSAAAGSAAALWFWVIPALAGQPLLRLYLLAEHTGCPEVPDMLRNSRTTLTNPLIRLLAWNMPFHAEHHAYPALPFHALPAAHRLLRPLLGAVAPGYASATLDILRGLRR